MSFKHGVYKSEVPTSIIAPVESTAGLPVIIGTAPVFMTDSPSVNKPVLCYSYEEAVKAFGYSANWDGYTICEFVYSQFGLYGQSPAVIVNVFDPAKHYEQVTSKSYTAINNAVNLGADVIRATLSFDVSNAFTANYDDDGNLIATFTGNVSTVKATYRKAKPDAVTISDVIGGIDADTGAAKGLEVVSQVFPKLRLIPGIIGCPKWSENSGVSAVMRAKCDNINDLFTCICVSDIPSDTAGAKVYGEVPAWKNQHNYSGTREITCWPKVTLDGKIYHMSTHIIGVMARTDAEHDDVPYKSPSNELMQIDGVITGTGQEVNLGLEQANYLNSQGIMTAMNFMNGYVAWGNRTASYPVITDPKDCFIPVRRMFDYVGNTFITTFWQKVDAPITLRLIETVINSFNMYLNGLSARLMILGGRIEFKENENNVTDLMNGILRFHVYITPSVPAESIEGIFEYDPEYLSVLFE